VYARPAGLRLVYAGGFRIHVVGFDALVMSIEKRISRASADIAIRWDKSKSGSLADLIAPNDCDPPKRAAKSDKSAPTTKDATVMVARPRHASLSPRDDPMLAGPAER
jgi:hypothetical protein